MSQATGATLGLHNLKEDWWDDPDDLPGPEGDPLRIKIVAPESRYISENLKLVLEALEPIKQEVRDAFNTRLQVKNALGQPPLKEEEFWSGSCEVEKAVEYLRTIKHWARVGRKLYFKDARGHVLRRGIPLKFPISGSNDVVLILREYVSDPELAAFLGIELKRGLTAKGLRQAEVEFYLWASCSLFPFVQIITDMQSGGVAFYKSGSSPTGSTIVKQFLDGMDSVKDCVKNIVASIPDDAGEDGPCGSMKIPRTLENPARKRHREDTPESKSGAREAADGQGMSHYQRGLELIAAMQPDVGNELLGLATVHNPEGGTGTASFGARSMWYSTSLHNLSIARLARHKMAWSRAHKNNYWPSLDEEGAAAAGDCCFGRAADKLKRGPRHEARRANVTIKALKEHVSQKQATNQKQLQHAKGHRRPSTLVPSVEVMEGIAKLKQQEKEQPIKQLPADLQTLSCTLNSVHRHPSTWFWVQLGST
ncbi:hypothetical protein WJX77_011381 [Trebouxia sp. C0004]